MSLTEQAVTIGLCAAATLLTRFLPFLLFSSSKPLPPFLSYLGRVLPAAVFGMLVVYFFCNTPILTGSHGIPELIALATVVGLHLWKRKTLLSIAGGTAVYMILVQTVF